jgi:ATP-dependent RNA helicase MSS116
LIPVVSRILKTSPELAAPSRYSRATPSDIRSIIISPTRELAEQIAVEAKKITRGTGLKTQIAVGGSNKRGMLRQMQQEGCHILVATPGRLNDLLTDPYSRVSAPKLQTLVLDEADRLLDAGFSRDIQTIIDLLPAREEVDRQTLLFSATVPREVMSLVRSTLKPDYQFIQTVKLGEPATHEKIPQRVVQCKGYENIMPAILELAKREIKKADAGEGPPFKALVYINSTAGVSLAGEIFRKLGGSGRFGPSNPVYPAEIFFMHGKLSQEARTRVSQNFRRSKSAIMFSSDVTARGMDFPNVTHVIQCGVAPNRDQYVHRIGRTGRGDKTGEAWTFLTPVEMEHARRTLRGFPISVDKSLEAATIDMTKDAQLPAALAETLTQVGEATKRVPMEIKEDAFAASFGPLIQAVNDKRALIGALNNWTRYGWGLEQPMPVSMGMARKLHIDNVPGVVIGSRPPRRDDDFGGRDNGGFGGRSNSFGGDREGGRGGFGGRSNYGGDRRGGSSFGDRDGGRSSFGGDRAGGRSSYGGDRRGGSNRGSFQRRAPEPQASF